MSIRKILIWPNPILNEVSVPVTDLKDPQIKVLVDDMIETMRANCGMGLAAIQVGVPLRIFVMERTSYHDSGPRLCINPVLQDRSGLTEAKRFVDEGCLSLPGVNERVERCEEVVVDYSHLAEDGTIISGRYLMEGLEAQCVQHEIEHLDGKIFIGPVGRVKREIIKKKIAKALRART